MIRRLMEWLDIWPTTNEALHDRGERCVKTGKHIYVVKDNGGLADAVKQEVTAMQRAQEGASVIEACQTNMLLRLNEDTTPFPKTIFFGTGGTVQTLPLDYNHNIADMADI